MTTQRPLTRSEASEYLKQQHGISRVPATLARLAVQGGGPRFIKSGRTPLYPARELDAWARQITTAIIASTSELPKARAGSRR